MARCSMDAGSEAPLAQETGNGWRRATQGCDRPVFLLLGVLLVSLLFGGCAGRTLNQDSRCSAAFRAEIDVLEACLNEATTQEQRCELWYERARRAGAAGPDALVAALKEFEERDCGDLRARAALRRAEVLLEGGALAEGKEVLLGLILSYPDSHVAGEAVKSLARLGKGGPGSEVEGQLFALYEKVKERRVAGHLLFYAAENRLGRGFTWSQEALLLLLMVVDYHSSSPLWDDAVIAAADLLSAMRLPGEEAKLLEDALLPNESRGMDAALDGFAQKIRVRLAGLYGRQGRFDDALRQLEWVVNSHSQLALKDDAMWLAATIQGWKGDSEGALETLALLVELCPWSRHVPAAKKRLELERVRR